MTVKLTNRIVALCVTYVAVAVAGCGRNAADDPVEVDFARCAELVRDCSVPAPANVRYELFRKTFDDISAITNAETKMEKARQFAELADKVDLELNNADYAEFSERVSRYKTLFDWTVGSLFNAKVDGDFVLMHLINGMEKYRKACFSIPVAPKADAESAEIYAKKCQAIISLAGEYEYAMMSLDKFEKGHLQGLPSELHEKYRKWKSSMMAYPTAREVRTKVYKRSARQERR